MLIISLPLKKLKLTIKLLILKLIIESKLLSIQIFLVKVTLEIDQEIFVIYSVLKNILGHIKLKL